MTDKQKAWLKSLAVFVGTAVLVAIAAGASSAKSWSDLSGLAFIAVIAGLVAAGAYASKSPFPLSILVLALLLTASSYAQVSVVYTPEPMAVLKALNVRDIGLWSVRACNDGAAAVTVPAERFYMAAPLVRLITPARARAVVLDRRGRSGKATAAKYIGYGLTLATALTGFGPIAANTTVVASLAFGSTIAMETRRQLEAEIPDTGPFFETLLEEPVQLAPAACATRTAFAAKMRSPKPIAATIQLQ